MASDLPTPRQSRSSSSSSRNFKDLSLDLHDLPPLVTPSPPSNTLIITNLDNPAIFHPATLASIRNSIEVHCPIHSFAPLKSFCRIIVTFYDIESATSVRQSLDGTALMDHRIRVYFGAPTPLKNVDQHLELPKSDKLFFISPPPSPPHGWEMRNEEPPNKQVHAEDLATALSKLHAKNEPAEFTMDADRSPVSPTNLGAVDEFSPQAGGRRRGSSILVYHPEDHGDSPHLPAIAVEDTSMTHVDSPLDYSPMDIEKPKFLHTSRPPVELMHHA